jgi:ketosteroid isomerase-like protein
MSARAARGLRAAGQALAAVLLLAIVSAGSRPASAAEPETAPAGASREARVEQVRQSEIAFAATVAARDKMRFAAMIAEDAVFVGSTGAIRGRDAIVAAWAPFFEPSAPEFEWHPEIVELTEDGSLGLTRGPWTIRGKDAEGKPVEQTGVFNSVWRRQPGGDWRVTFDAGCSPCPSCD